MNPLWKGMPQVLAVNVVISLDLFSSPSKWFNIKSVKREIPFSVSSLITMLGSLINMISARSEPELLDTERELRATRLQTCRCRAATQTLRGSQAMSIAPTRLHVYLHIHDLLENLLLSDAKEWMTKFQTDSFV